MLVLALQFSRGYRGSNADAGAGLTKSLAAGAELCCSFTTEERTKVGVTGVRDSTITIRPASATNGVWVPHEMAPQTP
jgi:hypothetical protein